MKRWLLAALCLPNAALAGQVQLKNDGFNGNGQVGFQSGFVDGECWASIFFPPEEGIDFDIVKVEMLVYGTDPQGFYNFYVREVDTNNNNQPGAIIAETYISLQSAANSVNEFVFLGAEWEDAIAPGTLDRPFAISVCLDDEDGALLSGFPQIARDTDGTITSNLNWIYAGAWYRSSLFGLSGDWILRATIDGEFEEVDTETPKIRRILPIRPTPKSLPIPKTRPTPRIPPKLEILPTLRTPTNKRW